MNQKKTVDKLQLPFSKLLLTAGCPGRRFLYNDTSLYIGSNSSIVNDLSYLKTPRILISVNKLQNINIKNYQDLGNYIYIKHHFTQNLNKITNLIIEVVNNFTRFKNLFLNPKIKIDKNGADRIIKILIKKIDG